MKNPDPYSKEAIVNILMRRDGLSRLNAEDIVDECQYEITDAIDEGASIEELEDIIDDYLSLEPDYLETFLPY